MHHVLYVDPSIYPIIDFVTYELADDELFKLETAQEDSATKTMFQQVFFSDGMIWFTLPETNSEFTAESRPKPKRKFHLNQPLISRG